MSHRFVPALLLCTSFVAAQSVTMYGTACGGAGGPPPRLGSRDVPAIGSPFTFDYSGPIGTTPVSNDHPHLLLGFAQLNVPVPPAISFFTGCTLLADPVLVFPAPAMGTSYATQYTFPVPNNPHLIGNTLYAQVVVLYQRLTTPFTTGLRFSNGLAVTF
jgi:hypothetical protein